MRLVQGIAIGAMAVITNSALGVELRVLSAGAIEPGLKAAVADFQQATQHSVVVTFNTAPQLRKRLETSCVPASPALGCGGETWDVVVAPPAVLEDFVKSGKLKADASPVGKVGLGVAVREGARVPEIANVQALQGALVAVRALVFNRASTGLYFESWLRKAGLYDQLEARTVRFDDGASVMERLIKGSGDEIGVGAITEILLYRDKGLRYVGPLPPGVQNFTSYSAASTTGSAPPAQLLVHYLGSPRGQEFFKAAGIE
ncbi:MAG: substrate-binding domain-containing protein [Pseudomonadota bacterium]|nr:substrate-binding domain-containing protein [Pseudomonadota bacterium]